MMDNLNLTYRQFHETFMQNHTGSSIEEVISIQSPIPFATFLSVCVVSWVKGQKHLISILNFKVIIFLIEFLCIVVSQILLFTLPKYSRYLSISYCIIALCLMGMIILRFKNEIVDQRKGLKYLRSLMFPHRRAYLTCFKANVNLSTTICILAVDFTLFPRMFAKTETFGFSLMDVGVGYFVVCSALVGSNDYKNADNKREENFVLTQLKRNFPLFLLGLLRIYFTKNVDYQSHNTEYGVHWNFFLTLTCIRLLSAILLKHTPRQYVKYLAIATIMFHQLLLLSGIQDWVLGESPRDTLISANREGIVSITGYIGLYLLCIEIRNQLLTKVYTFDNNVKLLIKLILIVIVLYPTTLFLNYYLPCSRRLVNVTYIVFVVMLSLYLLSFCLLFEFFYLLLDGLKNVQNNLACAPVILESISYNALSYFLLANLLTGVINLSIETLYVSDCYSVFILIVYMFTSCSIVTYLYHKKYKIM